MSHNKDNCPFVPKDDPKLFNNYNLYTEYDGMCRDCGNKWTMIVQDDYVWKKELVDLTKSKWYGYKKFQRNYGDE